MRRQDPHHPRGTGADAVLVVALVRQVADGNAQRNAKLVDRFGMLVAGGDALLSAFLDIHDDRKRNPLVAGQCEAGDHDMPRESR